MTVTDKKLGFLTIAIIILLGILLIIATGKLFVVPIGPGVPPPEYLPGLMTTGNNDYMVCSGDLNQNETVYFIPVGKTVNENYGQFPPLSRFSSYRLFLDTKTNNTLIISVWYFNSEADFGAAQQTLLTFLRQNGTARSSGLEINSTFSVCNDSMNSTQNQGSYDPKTLRVTSFAGSDESGIFLTNSRPLIPTRDDYFIQYIGVINSPDLSGNTGEIKNLIAAASLNQRYFLNGEIDELS
ncbi:hypothetical protein [Methanoregula sp.]|uniref:hypothetical protein n=1 Tax=Methanoregula sp. TaxID=2052170 RepID=UPI003BB0168B